MLAIASYRGMRNPIYLSLMLAATVLWAAPATPEPDPIECLDHIIQHRFLDARAFGMSRVLPSRYHGITQFQPENATEQKVVTELREKGYQVVFFLAGRGVLDPPANIFDRSRFGLQGPAFVSNLNQTASLPDNEALLAESRKAMQLFAAHDASDPGYEVRKGDWTVALRPLRASNYTCVRCHTDGPASLRPTRTQEPHLGNALGVAMYVYRR
jgi:hypothetical protein